MHPNSSARLVIGLVALLIVGAAVAYLLPARQTPPAPAAANPYTVWRICQERVAAELEAPATAQFPSYDERSTEHSGALWTVRSYVDSRDSFGAMPRRPYTCTVQFHPADATYDVESVGVR